MKSFTVPKILPLEYPPPIPAPHTRTGTSVNRLVRMVANTVVGPQQRMEGERDLIVGRKSDAGKLAIAGRLRRETTLTIGKIAQRLHLGSTKSANARIHEWMRAQAKESVNENLNQPGEKTNAK